MKAALASAGLTLDRTMQTTTFPLMRETVMHGIGVGLFLDSALHPEDGLVSHPIAEMPERWAVCLATPVEGRELRVVRAFTDAAFERGIDVP